MRTFNNAYEAYWFIYHHPNAIEIDENHPLVDTGVYAHEGFGVVGSNKKIMARKGKPRDAEYDRAYRESAIRRHWDGQFIHNLDFDYNMINPNTHSIDDDTTRNTQIEVWMETGRAYFDKYTNTYRGNSHDPSLDCSGATMEEALIKLAVLIQEKYGDYEDED